MSEEFNESVEREAEDMAECPSCGGDMIYDPEKKQLRCVYCDNTVSFDTNRGIIREYNFDKADQYENMDWGIKQVTIKCENCGGETIIGSNEKTQYCSFCGSQHMIQMDDSQLGMKPESLVPFKFNHKDAEEKFKGWINKRYLAPRNLKNSYRKGKITGMYMPYWTYDSYTFSRYSVDVGYRRTRKVDDKTEVYYVWRHKSGNHQKYFDDVLIFASESEGKLIKKIEPFFTSELVEYKPEFLAGYYAKKYTVGPKTGFSEAYEIMRQDITSEIISNLPGDKHRFLDVDISHNDVKFKHILLPIYMSAYKYNGKVYNFMINGQTGEVQGKSPLSKVKVALLTVGLVAAGVLLYTYLK